jgi:hypothetical protein
MNFMRIDTVLSWVRLKSHTTEGLCIVLTAVSSRSPRK